MTYPITYYPPVTTADSLDGRGSFYQKVTRSSQVAPYNVPASYAMMRGYTVAASTYGKVTSFGGLANMGTFKGPWQSAWGPNVEDHFGVEISQSLNVCYSKFANAAKESAIEASVNIAERNQALGMITNRSLQLLLFCDALRGRQFKKAAALLGLQKPPPLRGSLKSLSDIFLEYHFGWAPLIKDIGGAVDILQSPISAKRLRVGGKRIMGSVVGRNDISSPVTHWDIKYQIRTSCSGSIVVTNPVLALANRLGLVNPASVAWELVPYSFVVDWFLPVSGFLGQMTDWLGLDILNPSHSTLLATPTWLYESDSIPPFEAGGLHIESTGFVFRRYLGIPSITLVPNRVYGLKPTQAAVAVSLLLQRGLGRL